MNIPLDSTRQGRCQREAEKVKAFATEANAFPIRLGVFGTQGVLFSESYGLFTTTCGAVFLTSSWALTFWICAACSLSCATIVCISLFSSRTLLCSLRNSLSNHILT